MSSFLPTSELEFPHVETNGQQKCACPPCVCTWLPPRDKQVGIWCIRGLLRYLIVTAKLTHGYNLIVISKQKCYLCLLCVLLNKLLLKCKCKEMDRVVCHPNFTLTLQTPLLNYSHNIIMYVFLTEYQCRIYFSCIMVNVNGILTTTTTKMMTRLLLLSFVPQAAGRSGGRPVR